MKKLFPLLFVFLFSGSLFAGATYPNMDDFMAGVRHDLRIYSTDLIPDSVLVQSCSRALVWTSIDAGGVEATFKFNTVKNVAFYQVADSIVEIVHATLLRDQATITLKAWHPEFFEDKFNKEELEGSGDDVGSPQAYNLWADTLQLMPIPKKVDSIYLKCFVEHESKVNTTNISTFTIDLRPAFAEVAIAYACYLTLKQLDEYEKAATYLAHYDYLKKAAIAKYVKRLDLLRAQ